MQSCKGDKLKYDRNTILVYKSDGVEVRLPHQSIGEYSVLHARQKFMNETNVYSYVTYESISFIGGRRYGQVKTFFTLRKNSTNDGKGGDDSTAETFAFIKVLTVDPRSKSEVLVRHGSGPKTFQILQWKASEHNRTDFDVVPVANIVESFRVSDFKSHELYNDDNDHDSSTMMMTNNENDDVLLASYFS